MADYTMLYGGGPAGSLMSDIGTAAIDTDTHPFWVFQWEECLHPEVAICAVILFFAGILCSAAGIGGGGIYVAVLMVSGRLTPHNAVPLSKAIVFFGAVASMIVNLYHSLRWWGDSPRKHVIDTDACRLVVPATLIGTFLGVLLNRHTSDYIIVVLLTVILGLMTAMVSRQARMQAIEEHSRENEDVITLPSASDDSVGQDGAAAATDLRQRRGPGASSQQAPGGGALLEEEETPLLRQQREEADASSIQIPAPRKQALSAKDAAMGGALLFVVVAGGVFRFHMHACRAEVLGDTTKIGACNHPVNMIFHHRMETWMRNSVTAVIVQQLVWSLPIWSCVAITVHFGFVANREVGWRPRSVVMYQVVSVFTGVLAGLVGVGGGLILSPFFLLTGMDPAIAIGTSSTCVLFTSSSTTIQYIFTDRIIMSLAVMYGMVTLVASFAGTTLVHYIQDRYARKSYITSIVAMGVAISAMLSVVKFIYLVADPKATLAHTL